MILVFGLAGILYLRGGGLFSPGPLSAVEAGAAAGYAHATFRSHAEFESDCGQCHAPWRGVTAERCQHCHENVAYERRSDTGLHGLLPETGRCRNCHVDHRGREATITVLAADSFDHDVLTTFSLALHQTDYVGAPITCADCHRPAGFGTAHVDCATCHVNADPAFMGEHTALFGDACLDCHDGADQMAGFDHRQVFPLEGAHETTACERCHVERTFRGTPRECAACHEEPAIHAGLFGLDCGRCHTTTAWDPAELIRHTFPLDHGETGKQDCLVCHEETYVTYTCYNCHEHSRAKTREEHLDEGIADFADCVECHPTGRESEFEAREGSE